MPDEAIPGPTPTGYQRTQGGGVEWQPPGAAHLGELLPQYEIEALIGRGGMGAVYKGRQKSLDRPVAIKLLPPDLDDESASYTQRFKNEARIMARLDHPAIVPVHDFGQTSEGQFYFVMSFIDGTDVQKMIASQGRLPQEHALAITAHVCDALRYAHEHGVIHRDIKPANILINSEGAVKVADFGLAKLDDPSQTSGLTRSGTAMGTPDFVAPETLTMGSAVDGRADLYAVGVMLYQMLTGNVPRGAWKPASVMIREIDPRFDAIVQKAMQHDREERYQSAGELRKDLDVILTVPMAQAVDDAPIPAQHPAAPASGEDNAAPRSDHSPPTQTRQPKRLLIMSTIASAVIIAAIAAGVVTKDNAGNGDQPVLIAQANTTPPSGAAPDLASLPPDVLKRLGELRTAYDQYLNTNVLKPHEAAVATLEANYLKALERARDDATKKGDLDTVVAAKAEMDRLGKKEPLPAADDALPAAFKPLRVTFRAELAKLEQARDAKLPDANQRYDTALNAYQMQLTQSSRLDGALHVKALRAELAANKGVLPGASSSSAVAGEAVPGKAGVAPATKSQEIERRMVDTTWQMYGALYYFAPNGKGVNKAPSGKISVYSDVEGCGWHVQEDGKILLRTKLAGTPKLITLDDHDSGTVKMDAPKNKDAPSDPCIKVPNDPEMVKAAGGSPAAPQADGTIPPVGAPVSAARLKEIEGWLVGSTFEAANTSYFFMAGGRGSWKKANGEVLTFPGTRKEAAWRIQTDGTVLLVMGDHRVFSFDSAEAGSMKKHRPSGEIENFRFKKVVNDPDMAKAAN